MNLSANYKKILGRSVLCLGVVTLLGSACAPNPHEHPDLVVNIEAVNAATAKAEAAAKAAGDSAAGADAAAKRAEAAADKAGEAAARAEAAAERAEKAADKAEAAFEKSMTK